MNASSILLWIFSFSLMLLMASLVPMPFASSQRMIIYNATGNATDAKGVQEIQDLKDLPRRLAIPMDIVEEPPSNVTREKTNTTSEYPSSQKVIILEGAALKGEQAFNPNPAKINRGGVITWVNADIVTHTVTFGAGFSDPDMGKYFDSGLMGSSYKRSFDKAGEYRYFCQVHPQMVGSVIVKATEKIDVISSSNETSAIALPNMTTTASDNETVNADDDRPERAIIEGEGQRNFIDEIFDFFNGLFGLGR